MTTRKGLNISGHYVVSINAMPFIYIICTLNNKKMEGPTQSYFIYFLNPTTIRHGGAHSRI